MLMRQDLVQPQAVQPRLRIHVDSDAGHPGITDDQALGVLPRIGFQAKLQPKRLTPQGQTTVLEVFHASGPGEVIMLRITGERARTDGQTRAQLGQLVQVRIRIMHQRTVPPLHYDKLHRSPFKITHGRTAGAHAEPR
jgi:hypothetical protein